MYNRKSQLQNTSLLQLTDGENGCCGDEATACKYHAEVDVEAINTITYKDKDGNNATVAVVFTAGDDGDVVTALDLALRNAGLITDQVIPHLSSFTTDGVTPVRLIDIFSTVELVNIITAGGTTVFTKLCTKTVACHYKIDIEPADGMALEVADSDDDTLTPDDIDGDFATPSTDEEAFTDEVLATLEAVYGAANVKKVFVNYNPTTNKYETHFWLYGRWHPTVDGTAVTHCECIRDFVA